jgi:hypothetical protein
MVPAFSARAGSLTGVFPSLPHFKRHRRRVSKAGVPAAVLQRERLAEPHPGLGKQRPLRPGIMPTRRTLMTTILGILELPAPASQLA